jgi:hypothetical protein
MSVAGATLPDMTETQAERDAARAHMYAMASILREDKPGAAAPMTRDQVITDYAADLLDQLGADPARLYAAARAACIAAADEVAHPGRWRPALRAVELCQRAAVLAGQPAVVQP